MTGSEARDERRHVLVLLDTLDEIGGAENMALELALRLDPERFGRTLCVTRWSDQTETRQPGAGVVEKLRNAGVEILGLPRRSRYDAGAWMKLARYCRKERVAIIHSHKFGSNAWAALLKRAGLVPHLVAHEHMWSYAESGPLRRFIDRAWIARAADSFIAVSAEGRRQMIEVERIPPSRVTYVPNGIPRLPVGDGSGVRTTLGIGDADLVIGTLSNLRPEKALEVLIEASSLLGERRPGAHVLIAGEGPERPRLEAMIDELGLSDRVHLLGFRRDVADLVAAFDVAVCCSDFEGGPLSVMEYMDAAVPVVATEVGGLPELIEDEVTGLLVPPRDPAALATAIDRLAGDRELGGRLARSGRDRKRERHDVEVWVDRIETIYDDVDPATERHSSA